MSRGTVGSAAWQPSIPYPQNLERPAECWNRLHTDPIKKCSICFPKELTERNSDIINQELQKQMKKKTADITVINIGPMVFLII